MKQRQLKFRVWNGLEMIYDVMVGKFGAFYVNPSNNGLDEKDSASLTPFNTKYSEDIPVMQFTGVIDKNQKEIFDGDIIQNVSYEGRRASKFIISFKEYKFVKTKIEYPEDCDYDLEPSPFHEIIGNIFETPELLNHGN